MTDEYVDRCIQMLMEMTMMREFDLLTIVFLWLNLHRQLSDTRLTGRGINCNTEIRRKYIGNWNICINTVGHSVQKNPILYKLYFFCRYPTIDGKCHGYDRYIREKKLASWGKKFGRPK